MLEKPKILSDDEIYTAYKDASSEAEVYITGGLKRVAQAALDDCWGKALEQIRGILNQMALEQCDTDTMPYFSDYYWLPKDIWQALQSQLKAIKGGENGVP